jgi:integrase
MIGAITNSLRGKRDKAILLVAYGSLCRRSELVSIRIEDIEQDVAGMPIRIKLRRSKTDQEGVGKKLAIKPKTQLAIKHWVEAASISTGFLFRGIGNDGRISSSLNPGQINRIYKRLAIAASISERGISGHSIRVGAAQDLVKSGISLPQLMTLGRWSKPEIALRYGEGI